jgi:mannose-6-phosphate isomerase
MQPLEFHPILKQIRWGGRRLGTLLGKPIGNADDYAESWEIVDHGDDQSIVTTGSFEDWPLKKIVAQHSRELFGKHAGLSQFPLLVKFLDATDLLSLQVHPNDLQARAVDPAENGKSEAWVILDAEPESKLYVGLKTGVDSRGLAMSLEEGTVEDSLHSFTVSPGDCVYIPAGTVHAIGGGILLAEIQQSSDLTYRLYDWGRVGADGKPRPLHLCEALACIDFERGPVDPIVPKRLAGDRGSIEELVRSDYFVMRRHRTDDPFVLDVGDCFRVLTPLNGSGVLQCGNDQKELTLGRTILLPAAAPTVKIVPSETMVLLETFLP